MVGAGVPLALQVKVTLPWFSLWTAGRRGKHNFGCLCATKSQQNQNHFH